MRIFFAGLIAGIVAYGWGLFSWMGLPFHGQSLHNFEAPPAVVEEWFQKNLPKSGAYHYPGFEKNADGSPPSKEQMEATFARMRKGPGVSVMFYVAGGRDPIPNWKIGANVGVCVVAAWIAAWMLSLAADRLRGYFDRTAFVFGLGLFAMLAALGPQFIWFDWPLDYAVPTLLDPLIAWLLAGLVIAGIVRPGRGVIATSPGGLRR